MNQDKNTRLFIIVLAAGLLLVGTTVFLQGQSIMKMQKSLSTIAAFLEKKPVVVSDSKDIKEVSRIMSQAGPFELMTGTFTFKVVCDGRLYVPPTGGRDSDARKTCTGMNNLVVVRDERPTGSDQVEEKILATITTSADTDAQFSANIVSAHEATAISVEFREAMNDGVCPPYGYNHIYDTISPGKFVSLKNSPEYAGSSVWGNGVMAYVEGCASGAAYPVEPVMIYDPETDKSIVVTEMKGVPAHLWDQKEAGYPNKGWSAVGDQGSPYWSDLKWNEIDGRFEINLHLVDGRIQPYWFDRAGKDLTPDIL
jgi:hypothetical protein